MEPIEIRTALAIRDIGALFKQSMRVSWLSENITGAGTTFERPQGDVFTELEGDQPDFEVSAILGGRGLEIQKSAVHMYVWDRDDHREVALVVGKRLGAIGMKAKSKIDRFVSAIRQADPSAQATTV